MERDAVVHVIDDDPSARESLEFLLRSAGFRARTFEDADSFLAALPLIKPGCVISDVRLPGINGIELLRRLADHDGLFQVIMVTGHGDVSLAVKAMKLGAVDFIEKPYGQRALLDAVRKALRRYEANALRHATKSEISRRLSTLSPQERVVLEKLVAGQDNKAIASDHGISPRTVENHRANVMTKMGAESLAQLVKMAIVGEVMRNAPGDDPVRPAWRR